jgi:hypothetical protein
VRGADAPSRWRTPSLNCSAHDKAMAGKRHPLPTLGGTTPLEYWGVHLLSLAPLSLKNSLWKTGRLRGVQPVSTEVTTK